MFLERRQITRGLNPTKELSDWMPKADNTIRSPRFANVRLEKLKDFLRGRIDRYNKQIITAEAQGKESITEKSFDKSADGKNTFYEKVISLSDRKALLEQYQEWLEQLETQPTAKLGWVLRDMMQSTGVWTFDKEALQEMVRLAGEVGFTSLEIGGGQSYQIAMQNGVNPYNVLKWAKEAADESGLPLQILLRGANQFGFRHYGEDLQSENMRLLVESAGDVDRDKTLIVRNFDALNDPRNLQYSIEDMVRKNVAADKANTQARAEGREPESKYVHVQAALSYVQPVDDSEDALYSVKYYVEYARKLMKIAEDAGGKLDSLCIKDMSGQMTPAEAKKLIPELKKLGLPVYLHCHSTNGEQATAVQIMAKECQIDGLEVAVGYLAEGASHNDVDTLKAFDGIIAIDDDKIAKLKDVVEKLFRDQDRQDIKIPTVVLKKLVSLGIPGGAIPSIIDKFEHENISKYAYPSVDIQKLCDLFAKELRALQKKLGCMPLVTPVADIICSAAISQMAHKKMGTSGFDDRFRKLILGYYGYHINHATGERMEIDPRLIEEVSEGLPNLEYKESDENHPTATPLGEMHQITDYVAEIFQKYPQSGAHFGTPEEAKVMHVLRPAGAQGEKTLVKNILEPTEKRLKDILQAILTEFSDTNGNIPQARNGETEKADTLLFEAIGGYEGIIASIKDFVFDEDPSQMKTQMESKVEEVLSNICEKNQDAQKHRAFLRKRFYALFAAAVFWDIQRICRRTGNESKVNLQETQASSLEFIITLALRSQTKPKAQSPEFIGK